MTVLKFALSFILTAFVTACAKAPSSVGSHLDSSENEPRIFGAEKGREKEFADYVVGIFQVDKDGNDRICTGVLLSSKIVLTAAHCARGDRTKIRVHFTRSMEEYHSNPKSLIRTVEKVRISDRYEESRSRYGHINPNDIAMFILKEDAPPSAKFMKFSNAPLRPGQIKKFFIMGYGRESYNVRSKKAVGKFDLKLAIVPLKPNSREGFYELDFSQGSGACVADSGGPAFGVDADGVPMVFGIFAGAENVSGSESVCNGEGFYLDLVLWWEWIVEQSKS